MKIKHEQEKSDVSQIKQLRSGLNFQSGSKMLIGKNLASSAAIAIFLALGVVSCSYVKYAGAAGIVKIGNNLVVKRGGDFQSALDRAQPGDTIILEAGASYKGPFKLPNKTGQEFITIRSSAPADQLPAPGVRLDPAKYSSALPKLEPGVKGMPVLSTAAGAHNFRFIAVEFEPTIEGLYNIIQIGSGEERKLEDIPYNIEFDQVYIHGSPTDGQRRGIAANGRSIKIRNSYLSDIKREGEESQAIALWATDGNIEIVNNYLEAAAENILFGGAFNNLGLVPSNIIVRSNWMNKPLNWRHTKWAVKNFLEVKSGRNIKIENNLFTNNWAMAQEGAGILFRTAVDSGEQAVVENIEFTGNIVRSSGSAINIFGGEGKGGRNLTIRNNLFTDINGKQYGGRGSFILATTFDNVSIENNTVFHDGNFIIAYGEPMTRFTFRNNIVFQNEYGIFGDGVGSGQAALRTYFPNSVFSNNIIIGGKNSEGGTNTFFPANVSQVGFVNVADGNYKLRPESPYITKGYDGKQIGANLDQSRVGGE